jgi:branched-chain amino acid transport system substrate-binding protein
MMQINRRKLISASAVMAAVSLAASVMPAQAAGEVGVTNTSVKFGMTSPKSGAAAPGYEKIPGAVKAYFDYVNDNGGINGRKLSLVHRDDQYVPATAVQNAIKLINTDKVFALLGTLGTASTKAIVGPAGPATVYKVPTLFVNTGFSGLADKKKYPNTVSLLPSYVMEAKVMAKYISEKYPNKKIGIVYQDDDFGKDALAGFKTAGLKFDVSVPYASLSQGVATVPPTWIQKLKTGGAEVVVMFGVSSATTALLGTAYALSYKPQWILASIGGDATTIASAKKIPVSFMAGAKGLSFAPSPVDSKDEYIAKFMEINTKYNPGVAFDNNIVAGMTTAFLTAQAVKAAGANLTRKSIVAAIEKSGATFANPTLTPLGYSSTSHVGATGYWVGTYDATGGLNPDDNKYTVYTTDSGSAPVVVSTYKRPAMPEKGLPK